MCYIESLIYTNWFKSIHHIKTRKSAADIDIGFTANIKVEVSNCKPNDPKVLVCKRETGNFLGAFLSDLLKYVLVRSAAF